MNVNLVAAPPTPHLPFPALQGHYQVGKRNGGYYLEIPEAYVPAGVTAEAWAADLKTLKSVLGELDPRVRVSTQVGTLLWRFTQASSSNHLSARFQGRAQALPK